MIHAPQSKPEGKKSLYIGIAEPLYLQDHEMKARKLQAEVVVQGASSLVRSLSRVFGKTINWLRAHFKVVSKKNQHLSTFEGAESS